MNKVNYGTPTHGRPGGLAVTLEYYTQYILLIVLVLGFEYRRSEILTLYSQKKKSDHLRARSVGRHNSTGVDEGRKSSNLLAIKKNKARTVVGRGEKSPLHM